MPKHPAQGTQAMRWQCTAQFFLEARDFSIVSNGHPERSDGNGRPPLHHHGNRRLFTKLVNRGPDPMQGLCCRLNGLLDRALKLVKDGSPVGGRTLLSGQLANLGQRDTEILQRDNRSQVFELVRRIKTISRARIHARRPQEPDLIVETEGLGRNTAQFGKFANVIAPIHTNLMKDWLGSQYTSFRLLPYPFWACTFPFT